ncbi:MAG: hypothetical protein IT353_17560 [Gemmatimonadaceae bacterium]|nr:hypothetical protein [Gemmatimonadaceae bacterium]
MHSLSTSWRATGVLAALTASTALGAVRFGRVVAQGTPVQTPQLLLSRRYSGDATANPIAHVAVALLGRDSTVYVLDPENKVIHVASGSRQVKLLSRVGKGPGEMQRTSVMAFLGDSIALPDAALARVTMFALRGRHVRTTTVSSASAAGFYGVNPVAYGPVAVVMVGSNPSGAPEPGMTSDLGLFLRKHNSRQLQLLARLVRPNIGMDIPVVLKGQPANMPREQPFAAVPTWDFAREGGGVVVLDTVGRSSTTVTIRLRQWANDGRVVRSCSLVRPLETLSDAAYEVGVQSVGPPPSARDLVKVDWAVVRRTVIRPASLPPFRSIRFASDGTVWIRTASAFLAKRERYLVMAAAGCSAPKVVDLPAEHIVEDARGSLFITSNFVDDAPVVDMWRLQ